MHLEAGIDIHRPIGDVCHFFENLSNLPKWDRSVGEVRQTSPSDHGVGSTFDTFPPASKGGRGRMSYRVVSAEPERGYSVELTDSQARVFRSALWTFRLSSIEEGTHLHCAVDFALRWQYALLAPLIWVQQGAIRRDLLSLKRVLEREPAA